MKLPHAIAFLLLASFCLTACGSDAELNAAQSEAESGILSDSTLIPAGSASESAEAADSTDENDGFDSPILPTAKELLSGLSVYNETAAFTSTEVLELTGTENASPVRYSKKVTTDYDSDCGKDEFPYWADFSESLTHSGSETTVSRSLYFQKGVLYSRYPDGTTTEEELLLGELEHMVIKNLTAFFSSDLLSYYSDYTVTDTDDGLLMTFTVDPYITANLLQVALNGFGTDYSSAVSSLTEWSDAGCCGSMLFSSDTHRLLSLKIASEEQALTLQNGNRLAVRVSYELSIPTFQ